MSSPPRISTTKSPGTRTRQVISATEGWARSVFAADLDGDGDLDVISAASRRDEITWYENRGGQFALATTDTAQAALLEGDSSDLLEIVMTHRGRAGDDDAELATLELLFEEVSGDPLTSAEANALIDTLAVYRDTGSGVFEAGSDTLVGSVGTLSLAAGVQTLELPDGHAAAQVVHGTPGTFFVVVTLMGDANSRTPHRFQVTHVTESSSTAEDRDFDTPLAMESAVNVSSHNVLAATPTSDEDEDGLLDTVETGTGVYVSPADTGTEPLDPDTDDDGLLDGVEDDTGIYVSPTQTGTDPNDADTDDDGLLDAVEDDTGVYVSPSQTGTDPNDPDTDDDGLLDAVEDNTGIYVSPTQTGTDPFDPDTDDDAFPDGYEVDEGTNPCDEHDAPPVEDVSFGSQQVISTTADDAETVFAADLDGDGDLDVLSASSYDDKIAWYENTDGAGSFGSEEIISTAADGASSVFAADLDQDGDLDVLSASYEDDTIAWYENTDAVGGFGDEQVISTAADGASSVFAVDLDRDGDLDVLSASYEDDKIAWYENTDGMGGFGGEEVISTAADGASSVFAADLDRDGNVDVLSASYEDDTIAWYENTDGVGGFGGEEVISAAADGASSVFAADLDRDGDLDVLSASYEDDTIAWYENTDGMGGFGSEEVISSTADGAISVFAADVGGDGDLDVLSASELDDGLAWYQNTDGEGGFASPHVISTAADGATSVFAADVDQDGDLDVLSASGNDDEVAWYENRKIHRNAAFPIGRGTPAWGGGSLSLFAADLDRDGNLDLLSASSSDDRVAWYRNASSHNTISREADRPLSVFAADVDGDGDLDALSASENDDKIAWYENTDGAGSFGSQQVISTAADYAQSVSGADVDGDGDVDVLSASANDDKIAWYENTDGAGSFGSQQVISTAADGATSVFAADVDQDGDLDVLSASRNDDKIAWYENTDGAGSFGSQQLISAAANGAWSVIAADLDGDADLDVLSASRDDDKIAWYENTDGAGSFGGQQVISAAANGASSVVAADLDGDGDLDVLSASLYDDKIAWYENTDGAGNFGTEQVILMWPEFFTLVGAVVAADLKGDGDLDVLFFGWSLSQLAIFRMENRGGQFALATTDTAPLLLLQGDTADLLEIVMTHRGRTGDNDEELATLALLFEEAPGDPLSSAEANALIDTLAVYRDTGSGVFEAGSDTLVASVDSLSLTDGMQRLILPDGHVGAQVVHGTPGTFFAVVTLTSDARSQTPYRFQVTHLTEPSSTAEDRATDARLLLRYARDVSSRSVMAASPTSDEDTDGLFDIVETDTGVYVSPTDTGTDPFDSDTDDDGYSDGDEVNAGTNPNNPKGFPIPAPALGPWGQALLFLVLAGSAASGLRLRRRQL